MLVVMVESYTSIIYIYKLWYFTIKDSSNINYVVTKIWPSPMILLSNLSNESQFNVSVIVKDKHKTVHKPQPFWRERRVEADSNRGSSAYQPDVLPLGQTSSAQNIDQLRLSDIPQSVEPRSHHRGLVLIEYSRVPSSSIHGYFASSRWQLVHCGPVASFCFLIKNQILPNFEETWVQFA